MTNTERLERIVHLLGELIAELQLAEQAGLLRYTTRQENVLLLLLHHASASYGEKIKEGDNK